ncbi:MAG: GGDEF domain-containing protein [Byssovorax sp.]
MAHKTEPRDTLETIVSSLPSVVRTSEPGIAYLVVIYGTELGRRIALGAADIECGRVMQTDIPLDDDAVSRKHARFAWTGSSYIVRDLGSTNGTFVNDVNVRERTLADGDQIKIGRTIFKFIYGGNVELAYHEAIYHLMTFDGLTQTHNKRSFETTLEREVARGVRYKRALALVMFDIDHFKKINDELGHLAGDAVLRQLAALIAANVRREDVLARVGGEEFALLVPEIELEAAGAVAEKLRALVERSPFRFEDKAISLTTSFGVAALRVDGVPMIPSELYQAADERLYRAKNGGRNRVVW